MVGKLSVLVAFVIGVAAFADVPVHDTSQISQHGSIAAIRGDGPEGLRYALKEFDKAYAAVKTNTGQQLDSLESWKKVVDQVAAQRYAHISRIYWYTDLEQAKQAAAEDGKPILSLRMLGKLTDEFSCANSRFFRTALYCNQEISDVLRKNFVLHWQSVRPVPKVTIDFGDGRTLCRTITGNSAHYVLTADGEPLDILPGLYSPKAFLKWLTRTSDLAARLAPALTIEDAKVFSKHDVLLQYHRDRLAEIEHDWRQDINQAAPNLLKHGRIGTYDSEGLLYTDAFDVASRAMSKARAEVPILQAIRETPQKTDRMVTDKLWQRIADLHRDEVALDVRSRELIRREHPNAALAGNRARSKKLVEDPILRLVRNFEDSIALDTVRNKYLLEREIHNWFVHGEVPSNIDALNERVYAELFLTPSTDPWLGLVPANTYTALQEGGLRTSADR